MKSKTKKPKQEKVEQAEQLEFGFMKGDNICQCSQSEMDVIELCKIIDGLMNSVEFIANALIVVTKRLNVLEGKNE